MNKKPNLRRFLLAIPRGKENRTTFAKVSERAGVYECPATVNTGRNSRKLAAMLNRLGVPIVADGAGVWMAADAGEVRDYMKGLEQRRESLLDRIISMGLVAQALDQHDLDVVLDMAIRGKLKRTTGGKREV